MNVSLPHFGKWSQREQFITFRTHIQTTLRIIKTGPRREKTCLRGFANNTGADQPVHLRSLISAFVIRFLESIIRILATGEISIF